MLDGSRKFVKISIDGQGPATGAFVHPFRVLVGFRWKERKKPEHGASACRTFYAHGASVVVDNFLDDRKAKAGAVFFPVANEGQKAARTRARSSLGLKGLVT